MNVPYLRPRLPDSLKWRILGALLKFNERPHTEKTRGVILGALGAMNIAAACGVSASREAIVANLLVRMVSDIEAIGYTGLSPWVIGHLSVGVGMRFVVLFALAAAADFLWAGYISAISGKQAARAAAWAMAISIVSGVIAINYAHAPVLLVSLAAESFVGTYLSVASEYGKGIRHHFRFSEKSVKSACVKAA